MIRVIRYVGLSDLQVSHPIPSIYHVKKIFPTSNSVHSNEGRRNLLPLGTGANNYNTRCTPCDEDRFEMHNVQVLSTVMKEEETCYHSEQVSMTVVLRCTRCDEDRFEMHNVQVLSTVMKEEETCYHSEQVPMTTLRH